MSSATITPTGAGGSVRSTSTAAADRRTLRGRLLGLAAAVVALGVVAVLSVLVGARPMSLGAAVHAVLAHDGSENSVVVYTLRLPRTVLGLVIGAALGLAGALMQALTRNPLADPGVLGVNAGASAAVVLSIVLLGTGGPSSYVWFALLGAALASVVVYLVGSRGPSSATPVRLALAGTAVSAVLGALINGVVLIDLTAFNDFRFWSVGALGGRGWPVLREVLPFLVVGMVMALLLARSLNATALGDDVGRSLGTHPGATRAIGFVAVTLLCGAATAAAGPIAFVGLAVPHVARAIAGPDHRWVLPLSMVLAPTLLLGADVIGRVVARPGELEAGIVTALVGAPVFVLIARRGRLAQL